MTTAAQRFETDKQFAYRSLQDARQYNTDTDPTGRRAETLYKRLEQASRRMRPWSTDGTTEQARKAIEYLNEITSILSEKIGPASRCEFPEQRSAHHEPKTARQLDQEIDEEFADRANRAKDNLRKYHLERAAAAERLGYLEDAAWHRKRAKNPRLL